MKKRLEEDSGLQKKRDSSGTRSQRIDQGSSKNAVIIFSKVPAVGAVKTRLTKDTCLGPADAAAIAEAMFKDTVVLAAESNANEIVVGYTPEDKRESMERIVKGVQAETDLKRPISFLTQTGTNFDERFGSVVSKALTRGWENVVILGQDLPYLPPDIINKAFSFLGEDKGDHPIVLGPAGEGGIYLVGITRYFDPESFAGKKLFSGGVEISQFIKLCLNENRPLILLPAFNDVDIEGDLVSLLLYIEAMTAATKFDGFHFPNYTAKIVHQLGLNVLDNGEETRHRKLGKTRA